MSATDDLIRELEGADGPDRILDAKIECELRRYQAYDAGLNDKTRATWKPVGSKGEVICGQGMTRYHSPPYTASLDAALTLVPDGLGVCIGRPLPKYCGGWYADIFAEGWSAPGDGKFWTDYDGEYGKFRSEDSYKPNPAIALCIAAFKAREAMT